MAGEKAAGNHPANAGGGAGGNANKGPNKNNRRRSLRSKRRGRKPEDGGAEPRSDSRGDSRSDTREVSEPREAREPRESRGPRPQANTPKAVDKSVHDNRDRRRRRRMRAKQRGPGDTPTPVVEDILKDLPPLVPAFVYTHVLRPSMRDNFEFRTEHFSKVTRKLEDFDIDLSPLYPEGGDEIKGVAYIAPADRIQFIDDDDEEDEGLDAAERLEDPEWDAEQSDDAARLDGAIADDFYVDLDDSVLDDVPEEDIDA